LYNKTQEKFKGKFNPKEDFDNLNNSWYKYEGEFKNDKKHGVGSLYLVSGDKFTGDFADDKVHGKGVFYSDNAPSLKGTWQYNKFRY
jgi:hypothetical protein